MTAYQDPPLAERQIALIDLLDRLLTGGVVITGDIVLSIADIDLVRISLRAVIVSVQEQQWAALPAAALVEGTDRHDQPG
ncbi:gas vesicle protein [Streptomyces blattellae]|uniref:gas vesicle protein n=1 Tax=Streptomyces blattellae TaxID=2569855 RepID=UPI0012B8EB33|nr:gas vesicle protein [Streptomyces blattellae]